MYYIFQHTNMPTNKKRSQLISARLNNRSFVQILYLCSWKHLMKAVMSNVFDYKKGYRDLYLPKAKPVAVDIPAMQFVAVEGKGNPNDKDGEYQQATGLLYGIQYTIKMSQIAGRAPEGYFNYVVPPLEGLWWMNNGSDNFTNKSRYCWISLIRLPEFVTPGVFDSACAEFSAKKKIDTCPARLLTLTEGLCVQCMHIGAYNDEPKTIALIEDFIRQNGFINDVGTTRRHHEIYLSDPRKTATDKLKTVLRIPVKKINTNG